MSAGHGVMILQCLSNAQVRKKAELKSLKILSKQLNFALNYQFEHIAILQGYIEQPLKQQQHLLRHL